MATTHQTLSGFPEPRERSRGRRRAMSPGRVQYLRFKAKYPDALLLYRMGDFYECFDDDAHTLSRLLDVALTARDVGGGEKSALAGIPHHALDNYLGKLIGAGLKVAIAEQTSDAPGPGGVVDRAVVRVLTPGTVLEASLLDRSRPNYLLSCVTRDDKAGLAWLDASTGEFAAHEVPLALLSDEVARINPSEILADPIAYEIIDETDAEVQPGSDDVECPAMRRLDGFVLDHEGAARDLMRHFGTSTLEAFDLEGDELATCAAASAISYLVETQMGNAPYVGTLRRHRSDRHMYVGAGTLRDLDVLEPSSASGPTLLETLDRTCTPMGGRLLRSWLMTPLLELDELRSRQLAVGKLRDDLGSSLGIKSALSGMPDLERLVAKVSQRRASARELRRLVSGLDRTPDVIEFVGLYDGSVPMSPLFEGISTHDELRQLIDTAIVDDPPARLSDGDVIRQGFDAELDELRAAAGEGRSGIAAIERSARDETGIKNLKIGFNKVFGYYIEVSKSNLPFVPDHWERRQTLVNGERYVTPRLKDLESQVVDADERSAELQSSILARVLSQVSEHAAQVSRTAAAVARLDVCLSLADVGRDGDWVMPVVDHGNRLRFEDARHPVVESVLGPGRFVPNTIDMSNAESQILIITGPNMSGKSTYIRQAAILVLLSQIGGMVPASEARVGLVDRIFTRVGASDDLAAGRSTFMVEMIETASMLNQATPRSLAVLDEIGRGTSTYDGLAIARAVVEFIHDSQAAGCKTMFATHYHEMTEVGESLERARNMRVEVSEEDGRLSFLYRLAEGGADRSYGVHVARLAGLPSAVVTRALEILGELESASSRKASDLDSEVGDNIQLGMFASERDLDAISRSETLKLAADTEVEQMTPLEAMNLLNELSNMARSELDAAHDR